MRIDAVVTVLGKLFLRYGGSAFPIVVLAVYSLAIPGEEVLGSEGIEHVLDLSALALVLAGLTLRATAIGSGVGAGGTTYVLSRDPRYLGGLLVCFGISLMHGAPGVLLLGVGACVFIYACMVRAEESELRDLRRDRILTRRASEESAAGFSLRRALAGDWSMIAAALLALLLTEVHEYLPLSYAEASRQVLVALTAGLAALVLLPLALRAARSDFSTGAAGSDAANVSETRGIRVDGRVRTVDRLENALSLGRQEAILAETLAAAALRASDVLVDVGCGSGKLVVAAAAELRGTNGRALGIDATPGMIDLAIARARGLGADFQVGVGEALPLPDAAANAVTSSYFFHHLPSDVKPLALREMWRVLAPGGRLVITDYGRARDLYGLIASLPMRANFYEYVRPQLGGELERMIAAEGLGRPEIVSVFLGYITVMRIVKPV